MKKILFAIAAVAALVAPASVSAQPAALSAWGGWKFGGSMNVREGSIRVPASEHFGGELAFRIRRDAMGVLMVDYQSSTLRLDRFGGPNEDVFDMDVWYFMAGGQYEILDRGPVVPFGMFNLGVSWFNPTGARAVGYGSETMFATNFGGGVRVPFGREQRVSLRLEGKMHLNIPWGGAGIWCGAGGCTGTFGGYVGPVQGSVSAGLRFALGETRPAPAPARRPRR